MRRLETPSKGAKQRASSPSPQGPQLGACCPILRVVPKPPLSSSNDLKAKVARQRPAPSTRTRVRPSLRKHAAPLREGHLAVRAAAQSVRQAPPRPKRRTLHPRARPPHHHCRHPQARKSWTLRPATSRAFADGALAALFARHVVDGQVGRGVPRSSPRSHRGVRRTVSRAPSPRRTRPRLARASGCSVCARVGRGGSPRARANVGGEVMIPSARRYSHSRQCESAPNHAGSGVAGWRSKVPSSVTTAPGATWKPK
jgi:hypothetical protein